MQSANCLLAGEADQRKRAEHEQGKGVLEKMGEGVKGLAQQATAGSDRTQHAQARKL